MHSRARQAQLKASKISTIQHSTALLVELLRKYNNSESQNATKPSLKHPGTEYLRKPEGISSYLDRLKQKMEAQQTVNKPENDYFDDLNLLENTIRHAEPGTLGGDDTKPAVLELLNKLKASEDQNMKRLLVDRDLTRMDKGQESKRRRELKKVTQELRSSIQSSSTTTENSSALERLAHCIPKLKLQSEAIKNTNANNKNSHINSKTQDNNKKNNKKNKKKKKESEENSEVEWNSWIDIP
jgi:hypothetical protein